MRKLLLCLVVLATASLASTLIAQSNTKPFTIGRSTCTPYDPATLKLQEIKATGTWRLQRGDGAILIGFANREDAEAGLEVARGFTQVCYIGKDNTRPNRRDYMMEYWK